MRATATSTALSIFNLRTLKILSQEFKCRKLGILVNFCLIIQITLMCASVAVGEDNETVLALDAQLLSKVLITMKWNSIIMITDKVQATLNRIPARLDPGFVPSCVGFRVMCLWKKHFKGFMQPLSSVLVSSISYQLKIHIENSSFHMSESLKKIDYINSKIVVWCDFSCQQEIILWANKKGMFTKGYFWFFVQDCYECKMDLLNMEGLPGILRPDSNVYTLKPTAFVQENYAFEVCRLIHDGPVHIKCLLIARNTDKQWRILLSRRDPLLLRGFTLRIGTAHLPPYSVISVKGNVTSYGGYVIGGINKLASYLGFRCEFVVEGTRQMIGIHQKNGSWTGMLGMLQRQEIDFTPFHLSLTLERFAVADFSSFVNEDATVAIIRKPKLSSTTLGLTAYIQPFPLTVWIAILLTCTLSFICFLLTFNFVHNFQFSKWKSIQEDTGLAFWSTIYLSIIMSLKDQPKSRSSHIALIWFLIFMLLVSKSYQTFFTAFLTARKPNTLYRTVDELLDDGVYGISVLPSTSEAESLKNAEGGKLQRMWEKIMENPTNLVSSNEAGWEKVYEEKVVYLMTYSTAKRLCQRNCSFTYINEKLLPSTSHYILQKNSPFQEAISSKLLTIKSAGLRSRPSSSSTYTICRDDGVNLTVGIHQAFGCFLVLVGGHLLAFCAFCLECYINR